MKRSASESFAHPLPVSHLSGVQIHTFNTGAVDFRQVLIQFAGQQQMGKQDRLVLFQIALAPPAILADGYLLNLTNEKVRKLQFGETLASGFNKMSESVVSGCKAIETGVVKGYTAIEDSFVGAFLTREGESVENAKERLKHLAA